MHDVNDIRELATYEREQRIESGYDVDVSADELASAADDRLEQILDRLEVAPRRPDWPYHEPSDWAAIVAARPDDRPTPPRSELSSAELQDRLHAAWLGRAAGCTLGKPVEGWPRAGIRRYLEAADAYPITDYVPALEPAPAGVPAMHASWRESTRGRIHEAPRDDDLDYTVLNLHLLQTVGFGFTAADVGRLWLERMPFLTTYTAERAAYRNLIAGLRPPQTATHRNPYREWIGAQIRADAFGYASAGDPDRAARLAYADASLSHVANGIYGAMWAAALIAASFTAPTPAAALAAALAVVPARSRLAEALRLTAELHERGIEWERGRDMLEERYGALSFVHTINNAAVVAAALLWGGGDFTATIGLAVQGGWDTDCNGATAGSAFGAMHGLAALPAHWIEPLNDTLRSAIFGFDGSRISELARQTAMFYER